MIKNITSCFYKHFDLTFKWLKLEILINSNPLLKKSSTLPKPEKLSKMYSTKNLKEQLMIWVMPKKSPNNLPEAFVLKSNSWEFQDTKLQCKSFTESWKDKDSELHQSLYGTLTLIIGLLSHSQIKQFIAQELFLETTLSDFFIYDFIDKSLCIF